MELILPTKEYELSYRSYIEELGDEERYPFPLDFDHQDFSALLERIEEIRNGIRLPENYVASTTYWLIDKGEIVGVSNLRHELNDSIRFMGGHIGLSNRPSVRKSGVGKILMQKTIEQAMNMGIREIHIHCEKSNPASANLIKSCGGELHSEVTGDAHPGVVQRFIIRTL